MRKLLLFIALAFGFSCVHAQYPPSDPNGPVRNLNKYWWYRYRLVNDFMKIGDQCGESIPAQRRNRNLYSSDLQNLYWADATIDLGDYITMLATEYRQLKNSKLDTRRTEMELYYALAAFDRLDRDAESYCSDIDGTYPCMPFNTNWFNKLNGFFIRDDVPYTSFVKDNYNHFNRPGIKKLIEVPEVAYGAFQGRYGAAGAWRSAKKRVPSEESQDQVVQLAMGLALVANQPGGIKWGDINLTLKARSAFYRMINFIDEESKIPFTWQIVNPVTNQCVYGTKPENDCNGGGADFFMLSPGAAIATERYGSGPRLSLLRGNAQIHHPLWQLLQFCAQGKLLPKKWRASLADCGFWGTFAALSDSWYIGSKIFGIKIFSKNTTYKAIKRIAKANDWGNQHLPLLYRALFYEGGIYRPHEYQRLLDDAPSCGIHNYFGSYSNRYSWRTGKLEHNPPNAHHWSGNNLIHEWYHRNSKSDNSDCNGLDYMALFNLYTMEDPVYLKRMYNAYYREDFNVDYPTSTGIATYYKQLKLNFLEYLSAVNKISSGAYLSFRCGKVIDLKPGFSAQHGSVFTAFVEDYTISCGTSPQNGNPGEPEDEFYHEEIAGPGGAALRTTGNEQIPYEPSDAVPFGPDSSAYAVDADDESIPITCEMQKAYFDSLVREVYTTGNPDDIDLLETYILPNATLDACDSNSQHVNSRTTDGDGNVPNCQIYPNPNEGVFTIVFSKPGSYLISLVNTLGYEVYRNEVFNSKSAIISITDPQKGVYSLLLTDIDNHSRFTGKVIIN